MALKEVTGVAVSALNGTHFMCKFYLCDSVIKHVKLLSNGPQLIFVIVIWKNELKYWYLICRNYRGGF